MTDVPYPIGRNHRWNYVLSSKEKNMAFLKLSCDETPVKAARYLDCATNKLIQGEHRKTWNIVISYDEIHSSEKYSNISLYTSCADKHVSVKYPFSVSNSFNPL